MTLTDVFDKTRSENRAAFIGYLPAGFPTVDESIENIKALVNSGCDLVEVGLPFSDPMMDGPTIQDAADTALANGFRTRDLMRVVRETTDAGATCVVMSYWNPILQYGPEKFAEDLAAAGGRGTIIPDLIPEEAARWQAAAKANGLSNIMLVAPSSTNERLELTTSASSGFVYVTSHMGVTGAQSSVDSAAEVLVKRTREFTDLPLCVGLGVSNGAQAHEIAQFADGVIVGSALIRAASQSREALAELGAELAAGVRR